MRKKLITICISGIILLTLLTCGCTDEEKVDVEIKIVSDTNWSGSFYGDSKSSDPTSKKVNGTGNTSFTIYDTAMVSAVFSKVTENGTLTVQLMIDNKIIKEQTTTIKNENILLDYSVEND